MRQLLGRTHVGHLLHVTLGENQINLLERSVFRLGVEKVNDGNEEGINDCEKEVRAPSDVANHNGGDHDNEEVEEPVGASGDGVRLGTGLDRGNLSRVEPGKREPGCAEGGNEGEQAYSGTLSGFGTAGDQAGEGDHHGRTLAEGADKEEVATADLLDQEPGRAGEDRVDDHVDTTENHGHEFGLVEGLLHQNGQVVDDSVTATDLLEELRRAAQKHATAVLGLAAGEDGGEGGGLGGHAGTGGG